MPTSLRAFARFVLVVMIACNAAAAIQAHALAAPEITRGAEWLSSQVQANGTLLNESLSIAAPLQGRSEAAQTLSLLASMPTALPASIATEIDDNTEYVARQIITLALAEQGVAPRLTALIARQNNDGGFGGAPGFASNPLDTAWAIVAMKAANSDNSAATSKAANYLIASQDASGGYSITGNDPDPYITALAVTALRLGTGTPATVNVLNKASAWLLSQQYADGSWGSVFETSIVYLALLGSTSDAGVRDRVTAFVVSQQAGDGSWGSDPYTTALALRALVAQPRPAPTTGDIVLQVVDGAMGQAIGDASAVIQGASDATANSDPSGRIVFKAVSAGSYTLSIGAVGYGNRYLSFTLSAGTTIDLGVIGLAPAPTTGILQGVVTDGATGLALSGALISVSGNATTMALTSADGSYRLTALAPGAVTVQASKEGYESAGGAGEIQAGSVLLFSPALHPQGQQQSPLGGLVGQVTDAVAQTPLSGVVVTAGTTGRSVHSGIDGRFNFTDLASGTYPVTFTLGGYAAKTLSAVMVSAGSVTDIQIVSLSKESGTVAVSGKVTDLSSGRPIAGANVTVLGAAVSVATDAVGNYRMEGLPAGSATMRFSATGYTSETVVLAFETPGEFKVDRALRVGEGASLRLATLTSDQAHYDAYAPVTIEIEAENSGGQAVTGSLAVTILDPNGKVLESLQATWENADGAVQRVFDFAVGTTHIAVPWNTQAHAPGQYTVIAKVYEGPGDSPSGGLVQIAEKQASFSIDPTQALASVTLTPLPAFSTLGATEQVGFRLDVVNRSNVPITGELSYQLLAPNAAPIHTATASVQLEAAEGTQSILIEGVRHQFAMSGLYTSALAWLSGPAPATLEGKGISVAPGTRIEPIQTIAPTAVTPDGDKRIRVDIRLQGVKQE